MLDGVLCLKIYNELEVQDNCTDYTDCTAADIDTLVGDAAADTGGGGDTVNNMCVSSWYKGSARWNDTSSFHPDTGFCNIMKVIVIFNVIVVFHLKRKNLQNYNLGCLFCRLASNNLE